jgi:flagellar motor switch protein FliG
MDGITRAAVLLLSVGEERAAEVLKYLEPKQVQKVGLAMTKLTNISKSQIRNVVEDFLNVAEQETSLGVDSEKYVRDMLEKALGEESSAIFMDCILSDNDRNGLNRLKWLDANAVFDLLQGEHPQIIATILAYIDCEQAAEVILKLPENKRVDILLRMSAIGAVKPEALHELGHIVESRLSDHAHSKSATFGGVKNVAELINYLDSSIEANLLDEMAKIDRNLCEQIKEKLFVFENLIEMGNRDIQILLQNIQSETLIVALKGADDHAKEKLFSNMQKQAAELMRDNLEDHAPVKISEVETAQREILAIARKLADAGEISLK